jgi:hypothetical protein
MRKVKSPAGSVGVICINYHRLVIREHKIIPGEVVSCTRIKHTLPLLHTVYVHTSTRYVYLHYICKTGNSFLLRTSPNILYLLISTTADKPWLNYSWLVFGEPRLHARRSNCASHLLDGKHASVTADKEAEWRGLYDRVCIRFMACCYS